MKAQVVLFVSLFAIGVSAMPMLEWAGKKKVVNHHNEVPFHTLVRKWGFGADGFQTGLTGFTGLREIPAASASAPAGSLGRAGVPSPAADGGGTPSLPARQNPVNPVNPVKIDCDPYLLGTAFGVAYYFCYEKGEVVTLNRALLRKIKTKAESYVVYADICTLSAAELEKYHITFKKIPRDITRF